MTSATETTANVWVVCHRHFDAGQVGHYAFSSQEKAYLHATRLIAEELPVLLELDERATSQLIDALQSGNYQGAVRLYHEVEGNLDLINVDLLLVDQCHKDGPLAIPSPTRETCRNAQPPHRR